MTSISPEDIKKLRDKTGAGFMDCKKALEETKTNIDEAVEWLRKNGISAAEKKTTRIASDGLVAIDNNDNEASIIEINSETDFVARNEEFQEFVSEISKLNLDLKGDITKINNAKYKSTNETVSNILVHLISKIGEKITIRRSKYIKSNNGYVGIYIHNIEKNNMGKIGVIISVKTELNKDKIDDFLKDIAMHIAATNPISLSINKIDDKLIEKERGIILEQIKKDDKGSKLDDVIINKIVDGKIKKFYNDVVLLEQNFVKDDKIKIKEFIYQCSKDLNAEISIYEFIRFKVGEGIE